MSFVMDRVKRHRWSRLEYDRMIRAGVLASNVRLELMDGEIIEMVPQQSRHAATVQLVYAALRRAGTTYAFKCLLP